MKSSWKGFMLGVVSTCLLMGATAAYAASSGTQIEVYFEKLKYMFDGAEKKPSADQGQGFIYKGTTYVPLRFVSESLGKQVSWDDTTKTIWVGKQPEAASSAGSSGSSTTAKQGNAVYLTDVPGMSKEDEAGMLNVDAWGKGHNTAQHGPRFQIAGTNYTKGLGLYHHDHPYPPNIKTGGTVQYPLGGKYSKLTAVVGADASTLANTASGTIKFIGDGKELLVIDSITAGKTGVPVDLDVTGVRVLRINFNSNRSGLINLIVADPMVYPADQPTAASTSATSGISAPADGDQSDIIITGRDKKSEFVVLKNRGKNAVDLRGWKVLSVNGKQEYTFQQSFTLDPGSYVMLLSGAEGKSFAQTKADPTGFKTYSRSLLWATDDIWDDNAADAAELYNPAGAKVSEYIN